MTYPKTFQRAILATGGMDSTTLLYQSVLEDGIKPLVLSVDYGHAAFQKQVDMLQYHIAHLDLEPLVRIPVTFLPWQAKGPLFSGGGLADPLADDPFNTRLFEDQEMRYSEMFVEGRNLIMLAYCMAYASAHKIDELWTGYLRGAKEWENARTYKMITGDNSPQFVDLLNLISFTGFSHQVRIRAPFYERRFDKRNVVALGRSLGVNYEYTHSCYWPSACGECDNCRLRADALGPQFDPKLTHG